MKPQRFQLVLIAVGATVTAAVVTNVCHEDDGNVVRTVMETIRP